jgi:hypothetical protein
MQEAGGRQVGPDPERVWLFVFGRLAGEAVRSGGTRLVPGIIGLDGRGMAVQY